MDISTRFEEIRDRVDEATRRAGRPLGSVRIVAVSKTRSAEEIDQALAAGVTIVGENKVQEAETKKPSVTGDARWHFIGHLQKNKARKAVELFDVIHSVHDEALGRRLDRLAEESGKIQPVMVQVDLAGEDSKHGVAEDELSATLEALAGCSSLRVEGLMALPPYLPDPEDVRPFFARLCRRGEKARERGLVVGAELSMGMSHDFEVAIEEGATLVRIGTALFGPREPRISREEQTV